MTIAIIDYGSGNLRSAAKAFECVAGVQHVQVIQSPQALRDASHIVLPGVGAFADCMAGLKSLSGMLDALREQVLVKKKPFLGICVGMQMLFDKGHEHGVHEGLGWIKGEVVPLKPSPSGRGEGEGVSPRIAPHPNPLPEGEGILKIPHMGWNELDILAPTHPLLQGVAPGAHAYFVHSYHAHCNRTANILASTEYGQTIAAVVGQDNIMGTQFHPEKSQETGLKILANFAGI